VALGAGSGGEDEQAVGLLRVEQGLAGQLQGADLGVHEAFDGDRGCVDVVCVPRRPELCTAREQGAREPCCPGAGSAECDDLAQAGGEPPGEDQVVVGVVEPPCGGVGEPPVADAAGGSGVPGPVARERDAQRALPERLAELGDDLRGGAVQAVEDAQQADADILTGRAPGRRVVPGESEQVVTFVEGQP
jgi:hypothetical protein